MLITAQYPQCCAFERIVNPALWQTRLTRSQSQLVRLPQESVAVRMPDDGTEKTRGSFTTASASPQASDAQDEDDSHDGKVTCKTRQRHTHALREAYQELDGAIRRIRTDGQVELCDGLYHLLRRDLEPQDSVGTRGVSGSVWRRHCLALCPRGTIGPWQHLVVTRRARPRLGKPPAARFLIWFGFDFWPPLAHFTCRYSLTRASADTPVNKTMSTHPLHIHTHTHIHVFVCVCLHSHVSVCVCACISRP
jgi:hypothetical protein